jgi:methyl-accepting chemotaxis protein
VAPLQRAIESLGEGDLRVRAEIVSGDELGGMAEALNGSLDQVESTMRTVLQNAAELLAQANNLDKLGGRSAQQNQENSEDVMQTATAIRQMAETVHEISVNAETASRSAIHAEESAQSGTEVVKQVSVSVTEVSDGTQHTARAIAELATRSSEVGSIVAIINDIAGQTNLLALNAAIEAARAGEQGRGFAVVAGEVRRLAERTAQATGQITQMISGIQNDTASVKARVEGSSSSVGRSVTAAGEAAGSLLEILSVTGEMQAQVGQIAAACTEQSAAALEIRGRLDRLANRAEAQNGIAEQTVSHIHAVKERAIELENLIQSFKLTERG